MEYYTYLYTDPKTDLPVYVGKGKNDRAKSHLKKSENPRLHYLLQKRQKEGFIIEPVITFHTSEKAAYAAEIFWIAVYGRVDKNTGTLFNRTDGGDSPPNGKGTKMSEEAKQKIAQWNRGKPRSEETKQKIREKRALQKNLATGKRSEESRRNISNGIGNRVSWNKGIPHTAEHKENLRISRLKKKDIS